MEAQASMDQDVFKAKNTLVRTPPNTPNDNNDGEGDIENVKNKGGGGAEDPIDIGRPEENENDGNVFDKTQEIETDEEEQENKDGAKVKRLDSYKYKPFGTRSSGETKQPNQTICQGGPGKRKGTKKKCGLQVRDGEDGMCCDGCEYWFHRGCQKVQHATYEALQTVKGLFWICSECQENLSLLAKKREASAAANKGGEKAEKLEREQTILGAIQSQTTELLAAMKQQENDILTRVKEELTKQQREPPAKTYAETVKKMEDQVSKLHTAMEKSAALTETVNIIKQNTKEQCDKIRGMEETMTKQMAQQSQVLENNTSNIQKVVRLQEKENRAQNIILHNIEESTANSAEERKKHDEEQFKNIVKELFDGRKEFKTENIIRLGKPDKSRNKHRLMLVRLTSKEEAEEIYRNRMKMREVGIENKYISMDRTLEERKKYRELKKELEEKGPETYRIFRGRVIRRQ